MKCSQSSYQWNYFNKAFLNGDISKCYNIIYGVEIPHCPKNYDNETEFDEPDWVFVTYSDYENESDYEDEICYSRTVNDMLTLKSRNGLTLLETTIKNELYYFTHNIIKEYITNNYMIKVNRTISPFPRLIEIVINDLDTKNNALLKLYILSTCFLKLHINTKIRLDKRLTKHHKNL